MLSTGLSRDFQSEAIAYYMRKHLEPVNDAASVLETPLNALLAAWQSTPALPLAVSSVALVVFSRMRKYPPAAARASLTYQESLPLLKFDLSALNPDNINACLLTICYMSRYEDSIHNISANSSLGNSTPPQSRPHYAGIMAVLLYWRDVISNTQPPTEAVKYARRVLRKVTLFGLVDIPDWLMDGAVFGELGGELELDQIIIRLISLRAQVDEITIQLCGTHFSSDDLKRLKFIDQELRAIDTALLSWLERSAESACSTNMQRTFSSDRALRRDKFFGHRIHIYTNQGDAALHAQYYGYGLLARHLRVRVLELMEACSQPHAISKTLITEARDDILSLADGLASTIPFCLERVSGSERPGPFGDGIVIREGNSGVPGTTEPAILPLMIVSAIPNLDNEYSAWFRSQMADIGRITGYGFMLSLSTGYGLRL